MRRVAGGESRITRHPLLATSLCFDPRTRVDPEMLGFNPDPFRAVSQLNLVTQDADLWPLPDGWNARDLEVVNGEILLTHSIFHEPDTAGIYRFDPATSKLTMLVNIPGAQRLLSPVK